MDHLFTAIGYVRKAMHLVYLFFLSAAQVSGRRVRSLSQRALVRARSASSATSRAFSGSWVRNHSHESPARV